MNDEFYNYLGGFVATETFGDPSFRRELQYYNSLDEVKVDPTILSMWDEQVGNAKRATTAAKSAKESIKSKNEHIENDELHYSDQSRRLREMARKLKEAKRKWKDEVPFSPESIRARREYKQMYESYKSQNRDRHKIKSRIAATKVQITEKEAELKQQTEKVEQAKKIIDNIQRSVRTQFRKADKILAFKEMMTISKGVDFNNPANSELSQQCDKYFKMLNPKEDTFEPIVISLLDTKHRTFSRLDNKGNKNPSKLVTEYNIMHKMMEKENRQDLIEKLKAFEREKIEECNRNTKIPLHEKNYSSYDDFGENSSKNPPDKNNDDEGR